MSGNDEPWIDERDLDAMDAYYADCERAERRLQNTLRSGLDERLRNSASYGTTVLLEEAHPDGMTRYRAARRRNGKTEVTEAFTSATERAIELIKRNWV